MISNVRPVEAGDDQSVLRDAELREYIFTSAFVGCRRQSEAGHVGVLVQQRAQLTIVGPKVVAPFADAMRFVDRDEGQVHPPDQATEGFGVGPLRSNVEQVELAVRQALDGCVAVAVGGGQ